MKVAYYWRAIVGVLLVGYIVGVLLVGYIVGVLLVG